MRYEKGHKEETRRRIVQTAAARFRRDGIDGVGVADIMAEAGLTHGGFYAHFKSKEDLVRTALGEASVGSAANFARRIEEGGLEGWIRFYLSEAHRDHPERGCMMAALATDVGRHSRPSRHEFSGRLERLVERVAEHLPAAVGPARRRSAAMAIVSILCGALQLARAVDDRAFSEEILEAGITSALAQAGLRPGLAKKSP
jgi:TetR/AcrR family transcriptional repressor of nem operon